MKINCNFIYFSPVFTVRVPLSIMLQQNQMAIYRYERIPYYTHVHRIPVAFIRIDRIYPKPNASTVNPIKMLLLAMKQCMIFYHVIIAAQANRIQQIFSITSNCITFTWKEIRCCKHLNRPVKRNW